MNRYRADTPCILRPIATAESLEAYRRDPKLTITHVTGRITSKIEARLQKGGTP